MIHFTRFELHVTGSSIFSAVQKFCLHHKRLLELHALAPPTRSYALLFRHWHANAHHTICRLDPKCLSLTIQKVKGLVKGNPIVYCISIIARVSDQFRPIGITIDTVTKH